MYSIGLQTKGENQADGQGSTPLGSGYLGHWFSINVRPLWGPWGGQWSIVTVALLIIDNHGQWLIEPKFDSPFHFQSGLAEVIHYGQKRKINEKGEFIK
jgi:hypothetical protein